MVKTTLSKLRARLGSYCDQAVVKRKPIRIRRKKGEDLVLMSADEYDSWKETIYLLSSPRNAARLFGAIERARRGKTKPMTVEELRASVGL